VKVENEIISSLLAKLNLKIENGFTEKFYIDDDRESVYFGSLTKGNVYLDKGKKCLPCNYNLIGLLEHKVTPVKGRPKVGELYYSIYLGKRLEILTCSWRDDEDDKMRDELNIVFKTLSI
jgi:hypothetical protein